MFKVLTYSVLLIIGMIFSQCFALGEYREVISTLTVICLGYIMIEVGLEFTIDKTNLKQYGVDYLIAMTSAGFPWLFCALYFYYVLGGNAADSLLIGRFAAPTSAGVLFAMLSAAGLGVTWLFNKARILAIFDDLDTILFMVPLQMMFVGFNLDLIFLLFLTFLILFLAYRYLHQWKIPLGRPWLLFYSTIIFIVCEVIEYSTNTHLEVLLPAFALGCIIYNPHDPAKPLQHFKEHAFAMPEKKSMRILDGTLKYFFMFLVGASMPKIVLEYNDLGNLIFHVTIVTILSNLGKMFPVFFYRNEATFKERLGVSVAMFPRGEVGAGVLLVALYYGLTGKMVTVAALSLALNLVLTGVFILFVIWLIHDDGISHLFISKKKVVEKSK